MKNILLNLSNKLPHQQIALLKLIDASMNTVNIPYVLVGAKARDIIMEHVYDIQCPRATLDTDIGIMVENWDGFHQARNTIQAKGCFQNNPRMPHRLTSPDYGIIDIVPFGDIENQHQISWPPDYSTTMNLIGFKEAYDYAATIKINNDTEIQVSSLAGLCMLKIIAWKDRAHMKKDAEDIAFIALNYLQAGNRLRLFEDFESLLTDDFDYSQAGAYLLGYDIAHQASTLCCQEIMQILNQEISSELTSPLVSGFMQRTSSFENSYNAARKILLQIYNGFIACSDKMNPIS